MSQRDVPLNRILQNLLKELLQTEEVLQDEIGFRMRTGQSQQSITSSNNGVESMDWRCDECGTLNLKYDNICSRCGTKNKEGKQNTLISHMAEGVAGSNKNKVNENKKKTNEFGLIPQQPIYVRGIEEQERYLKTLYTNEGEKVRWKRIGMANVSEIHGMIDIYETKRQSGEYYKTIYINMYGSETSSRAPIGFSFSKPYQSEELTHRHNPARTKGCETDRLTDVDNLANASILAVCEHLRKTPAKKILAYSNLTRCDAALFTCFLVRALCIGSATNNRAATDFDNLYVKRISAGIKEKFLPNADYFEEMFANRMEFYDRIFMGQSGIDNKIAAITEEFGYILNMDKAKDKYVAYSEESPLVLLGIDEMYEREAEIKEYVSRIPEYLSPFYERAIESLRE